MIRGEFIFIGGTGRSGTTILSKILASSKKIDRLPFELRLHTDPDGLYDLYKCLTDEWDVFRAAHFCSKFEIFFNKLTKTSLNSYHRNTLFNQSRDYYLNIFEEFFRDLKIERENRAWVGNSPFISKLAYYLKLGDLDFFKPNFYVTSQIDHDHFYGTANKFYKNIFRKELNEFEYITEHTPYNFLYFDYLNKIFPNSKFIHIKRNPFDIVSSYSKQSWGSADFEYNARQIISLYERWFSVKPKLENYIEISLESLNFNREVTIAKICDYIGESVSDFNFESYHQENAHQDRWRNELSKFRELPSYLQLLEISNKLDYSV